MFVSVGGHQITGRDHQGVLVRDLRAYNLTLNKAVDLLRTVLCGG